MGRRSFNLCSSCCRCICFRIDTLSLRAAAYISAALFLFRLLHDKALCDDTTHFIEKLAMRCAEGVEQIPLLGKQGPELIDRTFYIFSL